MSIDTVKNWLRERGKTGVQEFETSSATVELAAAAVGTIPARIAKTLSFYKDDGAIVIVAAGDARTDNRKFKDLFKFKAKMLSPQDVLHFTGFNVGGVCPFALREDISIYLDVSLQRFETVFPACGSSNSAIEISPRELQSITGGEWIDVCSGYEST